MIEHLKDRIQGKAPKGARRSSKWSKVRKKYLKDNPACEVCGCKKKLTVHHKIPFHIAPDKELDPNNLVTLCESNYLGKNCHLLFGHLGNFRRINSNIELDVMTWKMRLNKEEK